MLESADLRVKLLDYNGQPGKTMPHEPLFASFIVENKRAEMAHIDASRSYVVDSELGALELLYSDRILPPASWCLIKQVSYGAQINFNLNFMFSAGSSRQPPKLGSTQELVLAVVWEDGASEEVHLAYEMVARTTTPQAVTVSSVQ